MEQRPPPSITQRPTPSGNPDDAPPPLTNTPETNPRERRSSQHLWGRQAQGRDIFVILIRHSSFEVPRDRNHLPTTNHTPRKQSQGKWYQLTSEKGGIRGKPKAQERVWATQQQANTLIPPQPRYITTPYPKKRPIPKNPIPIPIAPDRSTPPHSQVPAVNAAAPVRSLALPNSSSVYPPTRLARFVAQRGKPFPLP